MDEYDSLRDEIQDSGNNAISILRFGLLAISGLIYFGLSNFDNMVSSVLVFLIFCPLICYLILMIWVGEMARRYRASNFVYNEIEKQVNLYFTEDIPKALNWENWLRGEHMDTKKKRHFKWHRACTVILFLFTAVVSITIGLTKCFPIFTSLKFNLIVISEYTFLATIVIAILMIYQRISSW